MVKHKLPHVKLINQKVVFKVLQFGSTYLGVENVNSDLDLVLTIFDCLFDRRSFFQAFEKHLQKIDLVSEIVIVWGANVPLCKFKVGSVSVDLVVAEI